MAKNNELATKTKTSAQHTAGSPQKVTGSPQKVTGSPQKVTGSPQTVTRARSTVTPRATKVTFSSVRFSRVFGHSAPDTSPVELSTPSRTGRTVENLNTVLDSSEVRLKLAWDNREALDVALPKSPAFHPQAWTALWILRDKPKGTQDPAGLQGSAELSEEGTEEAEILRSAGRTLQTLLEELALLRAAVKYVTRADDPARETLKFGTVLRATSSLIDVAPEIIEGARQLQGRFPALTDDTIEEAQVALHKAEKAVARARSESISGTLARIGGADIRQLALDVLLDSLDYLRAAASTTLARSRPKLAAALTAPIEKSRERPEGTEPSEPQSPETHSPPVQAMPQRDAEPPGTQSPKGPFEPPGDLRAPKAIAQPVENKKKSAEKPCKARKSTRRGR